MLIKRLFLAVIFLLLIAVPIQSKALLPSECGKLKFVTEVATEVVKGKITKVETSKESDVIYTYSSLKVEEYYKGYGSDNIIIRQMGDCAGELCSWAEDEPRFTVGQKGRFFLAKDSEYYVPVCGWGVMDNLELEFKYLANSQVLVPIVLAMILAIISLLLLKRVKNKKTAVK